MRPHISACLETPCFCRTLGLSCNWGDGQPFLPCTCLLVSNRLLQLPVWALSPSASHHSFCVANKPFWLPAHFGLDPGSKTPLCFSSTCPQAASPTQSSCLLAWPPLPYLHCRYHHSNRFQLGSNKRLQSAKRCLPILSDSCGLLTLLPLLSFLQLVLLLATQKPQDH